jgi:hypothetical protein
MLRALCEAWDSTDVSGLGFFADDWNPRSAASLMIPRQNPSH